MRSLLWVVDTQVEALRLLRAIWVAGGADERRMLLDAILLGPPDSLFDAAISADLRRDIGEREILRRLRIISSAGPELPPDGTKRLEALEERFPDDGETALEAFPVRWTSGWTRSFPDLKDLTFQQILAVLPSNTTETMLAADSSVQARPMRASAALICGAKHGIWPVALWNALLHVLSAKEVEPGKAPSSKRVLRALSTAPQPFLTAVARGLSRWLRGRRSLLASVGQEFWDVWRSSLAAARHAPLDEGNDWLQEGLNHPTGVLAETVVDVFADLQLKAGTGLPDAPRALLQSLLDPIATDLRPARVIVASRLHYFFAIDPQWTTRWLLPCLAWSDDRSAAPEWTGYLWSPRITVDLFKALMEPLEIALARAASLDKNAAQRLGTVFAAAAMDFPGVADLAYNRRLVRNTSDDVRIGMADWVQSRLEEAGDNAPGVWGDRIRPWIDGVWPMTPELKGDGVSDAFARAAIACKAAFPDAALVLAKFMGPTTHDWHILQRLDESSLTEAYPLSALTLVNAIVRGQRGATFGLEGFLSRIEAFLPEYRNNPHYRRLETLV